MSRTIENIDCYQMMRGKSDGTFKISLMISIFGNEVQRKSGLLQFIGFDRHKKLRNFRKETQGKGPEKHEKGWIETNALLRCLLGKR
jgi:hypothetical protein